MLHMILVVLLRQAYPCRYKLSAEGGAEMLSRPEGLDMEVTGHTGVPLRWAVCDLVP